MNKLITTLAIIVAGFSCFALDDSDAQRDAGNSPPPASDSGTERDGLKVARPTEVTLKGMAGLCLMTTNGMVVIADIVPHSPADLTGRFSVGDRVVAIAPDGQKYKDIPPYPTLENVIADIRGEPDTIVGFKILKASRESLDGFIGPATIVKVRRGDVRVSEEKGVNSTTKPSPSNAAVNAAWQPHVKGDLLPLFIFPIVQEPARACGYFKAEDRKDAIYYYEMLTDGQLYAIAALYDTHVDFAKPFTRGIPEIYDRVRSGNVNGDLKQAILNNDFVRGQGLQPSQIELFRRALPKYKEWAATAEKLNPMEFQKVLPVDTQGIFGIYPVFAWSAFRGGVSKAYMAFFSSFEVFSEMSKREREFALGRGSYDPEQINALEGALKMSAKAQEFLQRELAKATDKVRGKQQEIQNNFN